MSKTRPHRWDRWLAAAAAAALAAISPTACNQNGLSFTPADGGTLKKGPGGLCAPCGASNSTPCTTGLECNGTVCQPTDQVPVSCTDGGRSQADCLPCGTGSDCQNGSCEYGVCSNAYCSPIKNCGTSGRPGFTSSCISGHCSCMYTQYPAPDGSPESGPDAVACDGPVITSVSPLVGVAGDKVTIDGMKLGGMGAVVLFNGNVPAQVDSGSDTQLVVEVPALGSTGPVAIAGPPQGFAACTVYSAQPFDYRAITSTVPTQGLPGTKVTMTGAFLGGTSAVVTFYNGINATLDPSSTDSMLVTSIPEGAGMMGPLTVTAGADTLTASANYPIQASFHMTCTSTGGTVPVGQTWPSAGAFHANGGTSGSVFLAGFRNWIFSNVPGTLSHGQLNVTGSADGNPSVTLSLHGTVGPDGTGSGTGTETDATGSVAFTWASMP